MVIQSTLWPNLEIANTAGIASFSPQTADELRRGHYSTIKAVVNLHYLENLSQNFIALNCCTLTKSNRNWKDSNDILMPHLTKNKSRQDKTIILFSNFSIYF